MKTTGVSGIPKFGLLDFLGHPTIHKWLCVISKEASMVGRIKARPRCTKVQNMKEHTSDHHLVAPSASYCEDALRWMHNVALVANCDLQGCTLEHRFTKHHISVLGSSFFLCFFSVFFLGPRGPLVEPSMFRPVPSTRPQQFFLSS